MLLRLLTVGIVLCVIANFIPISSINRLNLIDVLVRAVCVLVGLKLNVYIQYNTVFRMSELQKTYLILVPSIYVCCPFRGDIYFREEHTLQLISL